MIIFPCSCGQCMECRFGIEVMTYGSNREPLIFSRRMVEAINSWRDLPETPTTSTQAVITNESHDQKKSRLKKQHMDAMDRAFGVPRRERR